MAKNRIYLSVLILLLMLTISGGQALLTNAAPLEEETSSGLIDEIVWEQILSSPKRETTFLVQLIPEGEKAVDAQFRLEKMLRMLQEAGSVKGYQAYYGRNVVKITGGAGVLHFLEDWPELKSVTAYQPGEDWELDTLSTREAIEADRSSQIKGTVTEDGGMTNLSGIEVTAYQHTGLGNWFKYPTVLTGTNGEYTISGLTGGIYRVSFEDESGDYVKEYYDDKSSFTKATNFEVEEGTTVDNINAALASAGKISGTITFDSDGGSEEDLVASAYSHDGEDWVFVMSALTDESGYYTIAGLTPGTYRVGFSDSIFYQPPRYLPEYYDNELDIEIAKDVPVTAGETEIDIDAGLGSYGSVSGNVKADGGTINLPDMTVDVYRWDTTSSSWKYFASDITDSSGNYEVFGLGTEDVRVGFSDPLDQFSAEFYDDKPDLESADDVEVFLGSATTDINAELTLISEITVFLDKQTNNKDAERPPGPYIAVGDPVNWTYVVTSSIYSTGDVDFTIEDDPDADIVCPTSRLEPGDSTTCTASGTALKGQFSNTATVTVFPTGALDPFDIEDTSHYFGYVLGVELVKYVNGKSVDFPPGPELLIGDDVTFTYEITNTSNVEVSVVSVTDDDPDLQVSCPKDWLGADEQMTCTAVGTVIAGEYSNTGEVTIEFTGGGSSELMHAEDVSYYTGTTRENFPVYLPLILK